MALKIGVIGGGNITGAHLPTLQKYVAAGEVELIGLADLNPGAQATAQQFGIQRFVADWRELVPLADAFLICVPTYLHAEVAVALLEAGKAVFCEKPLARTLEQADAIARAAQGSGAPLQIGFVRRFDDEWAAWRAAILAHKIGRPVVWRDLMAIAAPSAWYVQEELGGGPFLDGCIHNFDFALHTFGRAEWAFCHGRTLGEAATAIDTGSATVRFESGDELLLAWSWGLPAGCSGARVFEFLGPRGTIQRPTPDESAAHFVVNRGAGDSETVPFPASALGAAFARQMDEFVRVARRETLPQAGLAAGRAALSLALAVLESARTSQVVRL